MALWGHDKVTLGQGSRDLTAGDQAGMQTLQDGQEPHGMTFPSDSTQMLDGPSYGQQYYNAIFIFF